MEITQFLKINDVLKTYPELEEKLIELNPLFGKLKKPILRKTVGKIATIEQVAKVGQMPINELVNALRNVVGQAPLTIGETGIPQTESDADWLTDEPNFRLDGNALMAEGKNPLQVMMETIRTMKNGEIIELTTDFLPSPMIDNMQQQGHQVVSKSADENGKFKTFIRKVEVN